MDFTFTIVQPYTDRPDRLETAAVVRRFETATQALAELDRLTMKMHAFSIPDGAIEMLVVDSERRPVTRRH